MMLTPRQRVESYEKKILADYACFSSNSQGRLYPQPEHPIRTAFQRDRDRVVHSAAFRRMEYKTQVFVNYEGDHYRTRLTHTMEVAQISRTIARALGLNEDLAEAIALVHDLGHTPFGHAGEEVLNKLMINFGGFNHNRQSLRVVDYLERRYPEHNGLNLTYEVREGIVKHESDHEPISPELFPPEEKPTLEASLVDLADSIAYHSHDVDDGLSSGILNWKDMDNNNLWREAQLASENKYNKLDQKQKRYSIVRFLVDSKVSDLINQTILNLKNNNIQTLADVRLSKIKLVTFSEKMAEKISELKLFLTEKMYHHPHLETMSDQARIIIETLFKAYKENPYKLHGKFKLRLDNEPTEIIISDFIAGLTDRYANKMFEALK